MGLVQLRADHDVTGHDASSTFTVALESAASPSTFLKSHWDTLGASDFTTVEVWTKGGLVTFYLLFAMELKTSRSLDRDTKFSEALRSILEQSEVEPVRLPARSPNLNAHQERFFRSLKSECLARMIFFGEAPPRNAVGQFLEHYHHERNHQGLEVAPDCRVVRPSFPGPSTGSVCCTASLG